MKSARGCIGTLVAIVLIAGSAHADRVYWQTAELLGAFFPEAARVTFAQIELEQSERDAVERRLGTPVARDEWTVFIALDADGELQGYAVFDEELGEHQPITFAVQFDGDLQIRRQEVVVYRESHGEGITSPRFRQQFVGRGPGDAMNDIDVVSGATISSHSMQRGVRRVTEVLSVLRATRPTELHSGDAPQASSER